MRIPRTRFAVIPESTILDWAIPIGVVWGIRAEPGFAMIDRRRLAREIRIECQSIAADIAALGRQVRRGAA